MKRSRLTEEQIHVIVMTSVLILIVAVTIGIDWWTETYVFVAPGIFLWWVFAPLWRGVVFLAMFAVYKGPPLVLRRWFIRATRYTVTFLLGRYLTKIIIGNARIQKFLGWHGRVQMHVRLRLNGLGVWWGMLPTWKKCVWTITIIVPQVMALPIWNDYLIVFPIGFMIPVIESMYRYAFALIADTAIVKGVKKVRQHQKI